MASFEILLASDFTARSDRPTERAIHIAAARNATLAIVHVLENQTADVGQIQERLRQELPDAAKGAELIVRSGSTPKILALIAADRASDLIITGVARYNNISDYFLGTAVNHIIRNAAQPVLVVKQRVKGAYRHILVATDLLECSRAALFATASLFPDAAITLVHAFRVPYEGWLKSDDVKADVQAEAQEGLNAFLAGIEPSIRSRLNVKLVEGETASVVFSELAKTGADLLALGTHGRSGFAHATIGSQAEALLSGVNADVLMVRERI